MGMHRNRQTGIHRIRQTEIHRFCNKSIPLVNCSAPFLESGNIYSKDGILRQTNVLIASFFSWILRRALFGKDSYLDCTTSKRVEPFPLLTSELLYEKEYAL